MSMTPPFLKNNNLKWRQESWALVITSHFFFKTKLEKAWSHLINFLVLVPASQRRFALFTFFFFLPLFLAVFFVILLVSATAFILYFWKRLEKICFKVAPFLGRMMRNPRFKSSLCDKMCFAKDKSEKSKSNVFFLFYFIFF